jgi:hypothetical protein
VIEPMRAVIAKHFPGVPLIPYMLTGATDGVYLEAAGIPTYGVPAGWENPAARANMASTNIWKWPPPMPRAA